MSVSLWTIFWYMLGFRVAFGVIGFLRYLDKYWHPCSGHPTGWTDPEKLR